VTDPLIAAARFLSAQLDWLRHATDDQGGPYAAAVFAEIRDCASRLRGLVEGPADRRYLGPCGAERQHGGLCGTGKADPCFADDFTDDCECWCHNGEHETCEGDVYGVAGAQTGRCRTCKAVYQQADRRIWLDEQVSGSDLAWTARGIADALSINVKTVRAWATPHTSYSGEVLHEAKLRTYYRLGEHIVPWTEITADLDLSEAERKALLAERGPRLHYVSDVRRLAKEAAERRAVEEARSNIEVRA
jgi:hypothetical protein